MGREDPPPNASVASGHSINDFFPLVHEKWIHSAEIHPVIVFQGRGQSMDTRIDGELLFLLDGRWETVTRLVLLEFLVVSKFFSKAHSSRLILMPHCSVSNRT